jgi:hypothetical protein
MLLTRIEIRMAIAKITAVGEFDWTIGMGSIGAIDATGGWFSVI